MFLRVVGCIFDHECSLWIFRDSTKMQGPCKKKLLRTRRFAKKSWTVRGLSGRLGACVAKTEIPGSSLN